MYPPLPKVTQFLEYPTLLLIGGGRGAGGGNPTMNAALHTTFLTVLKIKKNYYDMELLVSFGKK